MSLNNVVNNLVRAAAGIPADISDKDLDRHVAELLANEAKAKEKSWSELGLSAFLRDDRDSTSKPQIRPNKRFLNSVIRQVDGHNTALLRAQAEAAREARGESSRSGASRLFGGAMRGAQTQAQGSRRNERDRYESAKGGSRSYNREREDGGSRMRGWEDEEQRDGDPRGARYRSDEEEDRYNRRSRGDDIGHKRSNGNSRRSPERDGYRRRKATPEDDRDESSHSKSHKHREDRDRNDRRSSRREEKDSRSPKRERDEPHTRSTEDSRTRKVRSPVLSPLRVRPPSPKAPSPPPPPPPPRSPISKMDKYFKQEYDPRLDYGEVPSEGLVAEVGWDNMLAILKERGKKRRQQSPTLSEEDYGVPKQATIRRKSPDVESDMRKYEKEEKRKRREERKKRKSKNGYGTSDDSEGERERRREKKQRDKMVSVDDGEPGLFDMKYVKKGGVREWDVGK